MKLLFFILIALICSLVHSQDDSFQIKFFKQTKFKHNNGVISASVRPGESAGSPRGAITVSSMRAPTWLQVTLFEGSYWSGKSHVYEGPQKKIFPPVEVRSVKWKHL